MVYADGFRIQFYHQMNSAVNPSDDNLAAALGGITLNFRKSRFPGLSTTAGCCGIGTTRSTSPGIPISRSLSPETW